MQRHLAGIGLVFLGVLSGCSSGRPSGSVAPEEDHRQFQEFLTALENTLIEVNELERMGGGIRDRMILVDAESLVRDTDIVRYTEALRSNYGKIRSLRASLQGNQGVNEVLTRNGHSLNELVAIDAKAEGAVVLYIVD